MSFAVVEILAVIPVESPTVAKADTTSNKILIKSNVGSVRLIKIVAKITAATEPTNTPTAFKIKDVAILRSYNKTSSFPWRIVLVQLVKTLKVVVFRPPPVPPGLAPRNISAIVINRPAVVILPISMVLKPAVLGVTDWNQATENKSEKDRILEGLSKSKYSFIKNEDSLNEKQKENLKSAQEVSPTLAKMHQLKEDFRDIFESTKYWGDSVIRLLDWMHEALSYFPKSIGTMVRWFGEIVGYFDERSTNGTVEGINNKLKLIKRLGYGFRNFSNFRLRSLLNWHFSINYP